MEVDIRNNLVDWKYINGSNPMEFTYTRIAVTYTQVDKYK